MKTFCLLVVATTGTIAKQTLYFNIQVSQSMWQLHKGCEFVLKFPVTSRLYFVTIRLNLFHCCVTFTSFLSLWVYYQNVSDHFLKLICKSYTMKVTDFDWYNKMPNWYLALLSHDKEDSVFNDTDLKAILLKIVLQFWQKTCVIKGTPAGDNPFKFIWNLYNLSLLGIIK